MEVKIRGRNIEVTPRLQEYVEKKIGKLDRYLPAIDEAHMELAVEKTRSAQDRQVAQLTIRSKGNLLRAEERNHDLYTAIDAVLDKMYRQIGRYKGKHQDRVRPGAAEPVEEEQPASAEPGIVAGRIVRTKSFRMVSINPEEAIEQMELLGHDFYVFFNAEAGAINVLYRRQDGNYGLIQPEMA
jgi:ribosome hibernation promoting factor